MRGAIVQLTPAEVQTCRDIATYRNDYARAHRATNYLAAKNLTEFEAHYLGARGELAALSYFAEAVGCSLPGFHFQAVPDHGWGDLLVDGRHRIEVKTAADVGLTFITYKLMQAPYGLLVLAAKGDDARMWVNGWLTLAEYYEWAELWKAATQFWRVDKRFLHEPDDLRRQLCAVPVG